MSELLYQTDSYLRSMEARVTAVDLENRGIALDRDGNYAKTKTAYDALVYGTGRTASLKGSSHG